MSKDPAVLFYPSDFISGTLTMDRVNVGNYILLLCLQHQKGRLKKSDMIKICGSEIEEVFDKFLIDENGLYYNKRMDDEVNKRKNYCLSRKNNRKSTQNKNISETYVNHMSNICQSHVEHMENENINIDYIFGKGVIGGKPFENKSKKTKYLDCVMLLPEEYQKLIDKYGKNEADSKIENLNIGIMSKGYKYKSHYHTILSWENKEKKEMKSKEMSIPFKKPIILPKEDLPPHLTDEDRNKISSIIKSVKL